MNERKIIDRKYLCDLVKEVGLTTLDLEALGENHHLSFKYSTSGMEDCCFQQLFIKCRIGYGGGCFPI